MKGILSNKVITPFGGVVPVLKKIKEFGIPQVIRSTLKTRNRHATYGYDDILISWVLTTLCGGKRLDHVSRLKKKFSIVPRLKIPSHDSLGRGMKQLATDTMIHENISSDKEAKIVTTEYNDNIPMNRMLIKATKRIGALKEDRKYTMDIDATFLPTERRGAKRKVKENGKIDYTKIGFSPMVCLIGNLPVYLSLRNGNAGARFQFYETVLNSLTLLEESNIKVGRIISDAAGFNKKAMALMDSKGIKFNIRYTYNKKMARFRKSLARATWRSTEIETANYFWNCEVTNIDYELYKRPGKNEKTQTYRIVAVRIPTNTTRKNLEDKEELQRKAYIEEKLKELSRKRLLKELQKPYEDLNWKEIGSYSYKFFITNDFKKSSEEIVLEYNKRGNAERKFSFMKRDFGWNLPPFMNMNENTVFLIAAALANNIFRGAAILFNKVASRIRLNARLPEFIFEFISVSCEYIDNGIYVFYSSDEDYVRLMQ